MKKQTLEEYKNELRRSKARLRDLNKLGAKALSQYDIKIAAMGDAEKALNTAKTLVSNHIKWYQKQIVELEKKPKQLELL
jgi:hypothetical protein